MAAIDAKPLPIKNEAYRHYFSIRKNDGSLITAWTGGNCQISQDGATIADSTNDPVEIATNSGCGYIDLTAAEMDNDAVVVKITVTNTDALPYVVTLYPEETGDINVTLSDGNHGGASATLDINDFHINGNILVDGTVTFSDDVSFTTGVDMEYFNPNKITITKGIDITQSTVDAPGITITGNGAGDGVEIIAGATGHGLHLKATGNSSAGLYTENITGSLGSGFTSTGNLTNGHGMFLLGYDGINFSGIGGNDINGDILIASASVDSIVDAVWTELLADHSGTSGSMAEALSAAGASGDPWITDLSTYTGSQAGKTMYDLAADLASVEGKVDDVVTYTDFLPTRLPSGTETNLARLDATITSRLASADYYDDEADLNAIKNKTNKLNFTPTGEVDANVTYLDEIELTSNIVTAFRYFFEVATPTKTINNAGVGGTAYTPTDIRTELENNPITVITDAASRTASKADVSTISSNLQTLFDDWVDGGRLDLIIDAIKAQTDKLTFTSSYVQVVLHDATASGLAKFATVDTGESSAVANSVASLSKGASGVSNNRNAF